MNLSEIAQFRQRQAAEEASARRALGGLAITASHVRQSFDSRDGSAWHTECCEECKQKYQRQNAAGSRSTPQARNEKRKETLTWQVAVTP